ncbi:MAG TPA: hypothetical protein VGE27_04270 [Gemmatimonas sp.]|uniref:hypothetical protein n=1 Tax=Gemmatimonas sp. TaxID=1962908 RepID=UPI002EDA3A7A
MASAFEARFTNVTRTPKFANARMRLGRYAFSPSKLVSDTALWTGMQSTTRGAERELDIHAQLSGNAYRFDARPNAPVPTRPGEQRHTIRLTQQAESDWLWHTAVQHHVGTMPPQSLNGIMRGLLLSAERPATTLRNDYRTTLPRTTAAFGRVVSLDSIATTAQADGSTLVNLKFRVDADRIKETFPAYAKFLRKYVESSKWRYRLTDRTGAEWFDVQSANKVVTMRFRSHDGRLQPIAGAARAMPDTLQITADALAKFGLFTVGATNLRGDFIHIDTPQERAWLLRFTHEPEWHLPLIGERLMRTPLKHLFAGEGVKFKLGFRATPGGTLSERALDLPVRESAIMRFLGNLGFTAMSDFAGAVEEEENRFLADTFKAMRADLAALPQVP